MKTKAIVHNWRILPGRYHSPHTTVKEYFKGHRNKLTPTSDCFYTDNVEWSDPNGGKVRLLIEMANGLNSTGRMVWGVTVLAVTNYKGFKDKYFVGCTSLGNVFEREVDARWYCKDLLDATYDGTLTVPDTVK